MKPLCFLFGIGFGVMFTNSLWVHEMADKTGNLVLASLFMIAGIFATHYNWFDKEDK